MVQVNVNPKHLADLLYNASLLADAPEGTNGVEYVLLEVGETKLKAYAAGSHTAGYGAIDLAKENDQGTFSVVITKAEAIDLQSMVRRTSSAKSAVVVVDIDEDGQPYAHPEYGEYTANLVITYGNEDICAIEDADPDGVLTDHWDRVEELCKQREVGDTTSVTFKASSLAVVSKFKPPREFLTLKTTKERFAMVVTEGWVVVVGDARPDGLHPEPPPSLQEESSPPED